MPTATNAYNLTTPAPDAPPRGAYEGRRSASDAPDPDAVVALLESVFEPGDGALALIPPVVDAGSGTPPADARQPVPPPPVNLGGNGGQRLGYQANGPQPPQPAAPPRPPGPMDVVQVGATGRRLVLRTMDQAEAGEQQHGVKYVTADDERRQKYLVTLGAKITRRGKPFDTRQIRQHFVDKQPRKPEDERQHVGGRPMDGYGWDETADRSLAEWGTSGLLWIALPGPTDDRVEFYSHCGRLGHFHHSSLSAGARWSAPASGSWRTGRSGGSAGTAGTTCRP